MAMKGAFVSFDFDNDRILQAYGLSEEEADFLIHYDIKYRMGRDAEGEDA